MLTFKIDDRPLNVKCVGGMSAELCFTKWLAAVGRKSYDGWVTTPVMGNDNFVSSTLDGICQKVRALKKRYNFALISPGFVSAPYIFELADCVYLPSQLLVNTNSIAHLDDIVSTAQKNGIDCYAVMGYDSCLPGVACAWIKFRTIPHQYISILSETQVKNVLCMGMYDIANKTFGENIVRKHTLYKDVFTVFVRESTFRTPEAQADDIIELKSVLRDFAEVQVGKVDTRIGDWECGMDFMPEFAQSIEDLLNVRVYTASANDSAALYKLSWFLSKQAMDTNDITPIGLIANHYFVNEPIREVTNGFRAFCYWQFNPISGELLKNLCGEDKFNFGFTRGNVYNVSGVVSTLVEEQLEEFNYPLKCLDKKLALRHVLLACKECGVNVL